MSSGVIQHLSTIFKTHIGYFLFSFVIFSMVYCVTHGGRERRVVIAFLVAYIFIVLVGTVFTREGNAESKVNVTPFWTYRVIARGGWKARWLTKQIVLNVLMMIPFGILVPMLLKKEKSWCTIPLGIVFSAFIELIQLLLRRGLFEIDDLIHNTLGCMIGYCIYLLYSKCNGKVFKRRKNNLECNSMTEKDE